MSNKYKFEDNFTAIRTAFDEAKVLLETGGLDMLQYRTLLNNLLQEVKEMDKNLNNEKVKKSLDLLVNKDTKGTSRS